MRGAGCAAWGRNAAGEGEGRRHSRFTGGTRRPGTIPNFWRELHTFPEVSAKSIFERPSKVLTWVGGHTYCPSEVGRVIESM